MNLDLGWYESKFWLIWNQIWTDMQPDLGWYETRFWLIWNQIWTDIKPDLGWYETMNQNSKIWSSSREVLLLGEYIYIWADIKPDLGWYETRFTLIWHHESEFENKVTFSNTFYKSWGWNSIHIIIK